MKFTFTLLVLILLVSPNTQAQVCPEKYEIFDNTQVQTISMGQNACFVTVHPRDSYVDLIYRDFLFSNDGAFVVFNSYGKGPESVSTAAREFYFFPRIKTTIDYQYDPTEKVLRVTSPAGKEFLFNTEKTILVEISGATIQQDYTVEPKNNGGIEIISTDNLLMDGGFKIGQSPSQNRKNSILFKDKIGKTCSLINNDVYRYNSDGDPIFKHTDSQLRGLLKNRCPKLQF